MDKIHCVYTNISQTLLADIIKQHTERSPSMGMTITHVDENELLDYIKKHTVDVVMLDKQPGQISGMIDEVLAREQEILIVLIIDKGKRLCLYIDNPGPFEFVELLKCIRKHCAREGGS